MSDQLSNNTTTVHPTHFVRAVELIKKATEEFGLCSENWIYPTPFRIGAPRDHYYAEIWYNGMDWQNNYWLIEERGVDGIKCEPFVVFPHHSVEAKFNEMREFFRAALYYRRDTVWAKKDPIWIFNDTVWSFTWRCDPEDRKYKDSCVKVGMYHASQPPVEFHINEGCVPLDKIREGRPSGAVDPPNYKSIVNDLLNEKSLMSVMMGINPELDALIEKRVKLRTDIPGGLS